MNRDAKNPSGEYAVRLVSRNLLAVIILAAGFGTYRMSLGTPQFMEYLKALGAEPSWLATCVLSPWYFWLLPTLAVLAIAKEFLWGSNAKALKLNVALLVSVYLIWEMYVQGVFMSFHQILNLLQGR